VTFLYKCGARFESPREAFLHRTADGFHAPVLIEEKQLSGIEREFLHEEIDSIARHK
jgi:hypothetical protein